MGDRLLHFQLNRNRRTRDCPKRNSERSSRKETICCCDWLDEGAAQARGLGPPEEPHPHPRGCYRPTKVRV